MARRSGDGLNRKPACRHNQPTAQPSRSFPSSVVPEPLFSFHSMRRNEKTTKHIKTNNEKHEGTTGSRSGAAQPPEVLSISQTLALQPRMPKNAKPAGSVPARPIHPQTLLSSATTPLQEAGQPFMRKGESVDRAWHAAICPVAVVHPHEMARYSRGRPRL